MRIALSVPVQPRRDRDQRPGQQLGVDLALLVAGGDAGLVGHDPHLHEVHRVGVAVAARSRQESFFSECRIPVPALIRWASPG